jgi:hypothetical protein
MTDELDTAAEAKRERAARGRWAAGGAGVLMLVLVALWTQRAPIAENLIAREMAARGMNGTYRLVAVGPRTQRLENVVLGDPARPDLVARWVEIDLGVGGWSPRIAAIRAGGVRLRGRIGPDGLGLGEVDKLLPRGGGGGAGLPDIDLMLSDARMRLDSAGGTLGLALEGRGNLKSGFAGRLGLAAPALRASGCAMAGLRGDFRVRTLAGAPHVDGPLDLAALRCRGGALTIDRARLSLAAGLDATLRRWRGQAELRVPRFMAAGATLAAPVLTTEFAGDARRANGRLWAGGERLVAGGLAASRIELSGPYSLSTTPAFEARFKASLALRGARLADPRAPDRLAARLSATPLAPIVVALTGAVGRAQRDNRIIAALTLRQRGGRGGLSLTQATFDAASGAHAALAEDSWLTLAWPGGAVALDGALSMSGGGLPDAALRLSRRGRGLGGQLFLRDYRAGEARLALAPVRFVALPDGSSHVTTQVTLDGPLPGGGVRGLRFPLDARLSPAGRLTIGGCVPVAWRALRLGTLTLDPQSVRLCPAAGRPLLAAGAGAAGGTPRLAATTLTGRLGQSPLTLRAKDAAYRLENNRFHVADGAVTIGARETPLRLAFASLDGAVARGALGGTIDGGRGRIGAVPLDLSAIGGRWRFARGRLDVTGGLRVADVEPAARFVPLDARDVTLTLAGSRIDTRGTLVQPTRGVAVADVTITHALASGRGEADLAVAGLRFGPALQPDDLTPAALGVVANVDGVVNGAGRIEWSGSAVTSRGRFATQGMNLAAAFGPVRNLSTTLDFTDLLALETAPGQTVTLGTVSAGVDVSDGVARFQLLRDRRARIEGGEWPFAGGRLGLLPTTLDFGAEKPRHLAFRVVGLDAGAFINTLQLENISATGTFDGLLPIVFDANGGRITGGLLVARQSGLPPLVIDRTEGLTVPCDPARQGGTLAYVGDVSNAQLGTFGKLAFDALKNLRYKCLTILMDGALDGEVVTQVAFNGVNQGTPEGRRSAFTRNFIGLPFIFNVRIEAPFRGLINTVQSFTDPGLLIRNSLGGGFQPVIENRLAVQPADSDKAP